MSAITDRALGPGAPLPSCKELAATHGAAHVTVRRALDSLVCDRVLERFGRGYRVDRGPSPPSRATVVVIAFTADMHILSALSPRAQELWRQLQSQCVSRGLAVRVVDCESAVGSKRGHYLESQSVVELAAQEAVVGFMVLTTGLSADWRARIRELLSQHAQPAAFVDENSSTRPPPAGKGRQREWCRTFCPSREMTAGESVGNHLRSLGHRRIACFTLSDDVAWCRQRREGLESSFARAGMTGAVVSVATPEVSDFEHRERHLRQHPAYARFLDSTAAFFGGVTAVTEGMMDYFHNFHAVPYAWSKFLAQRLESGFERARADQSITAWVATNDDVAFHALAYLNRLQVRVPHALSVVGFDDTVDAFGEGLTSYNFNMAGVVAAALDHILNRIRPIGASGSEIPGFLSVRHSTAAPRPH